MQLTQRHRKFVNKLFSGATAKDAYLHAFPDSKPITARSAGSRLRRSARIQAALAELRQKAEALPDADFVNYVEARKFLARVIRAKVATEPDTSDLWVGRKSTKGDTYLRFPDKLRALVQDAKLGGYDRPQINHPDPTQDSLIQLLRRIRLQNRAALRERESPAALSVPQISLVPSSASARHLTPTGWR